MEITNEQIAKIMKDSYNQAIDDAAKNVKMLAFPNELEEWEVVPDEITREDVDAEENGCSKGFTIEINKESILKLKKL